MILDQRKDLLEFPPAFLTRMADLLGNEYEEFLSSLQQRPLMGLRINALKTSFDEFTPISPYSLSPIPWCSSGFIIDEHANQTGSIPPGKHPYHSAGVYYLQEPSAMAAGEALAPHPGEKVLDLAAAPGGKTTHLAALMQNTGLLIANEIHPKRVWDLAENLERCGVTNAVVTNETPQKLADNFGEFFDRVMLDAPCSGEGMFRKADIARREWKPGLPSSCAARQTSILEQASRMVKPGGFLAYTTCTFSPEENEGVIARFLQQHPEFELSTDIQLPGLSPARPDWCNIPHADMLIHAKRIWPHKSQGEGHFIAILIKEGSVENSESSSRPRKYHRKSGITKDSTRNYQILEEFTRSSLKMQFASSQLCFRGSYVYQVSLELPNLVRLKIIHPGWWLGTIHKNRFTPSHALAMGIYADSAKQTEVLVCEDECVPAYLAGESFSSPGENGWVLVTVDGFPLGWGKRTQNMIKNFYPHGLRKPYGNKNQRR